MKGEIKSNDVTGIHFYNEKYIRILEILDKNEKEVVLARIEVYSEKDNLWIKKSKSTTLFPLKWSATQLLEELDFAYKRIKPKSDTKYTFEGITMSGVKIDFIMNGEKMKTAYPII